ncbi:DoxX family membrane protein [Streptomyces sp. NPDC058964]|uniref:DoxX family protein n=1 Tax=Streptomyces sp. NPDC058964 TaxID=3346681 RepID=UPI0036BBF77C
MSVDTRTPRTPTGDRSSGFDDAPALSMVKVPSDPAQVIVNHASFRVQLGASTRRAQSPRVARHLSYPQDTARVPVVGAAGRAGTAGPRRRPVVWSGRSEPDDTGAHRLLQAVRGGSVHHPEEPSVDAGATQVIPRVGYGGYGDGGYDDVDRTVETPVVGHQRTPVAGETRLLPHMRTVGSAYDEPSYDESLYDESLYDESLYDDEEFEDFEEPAETAAERRGRRHGDDPARHAYYPGRRMNLGVVLLPLRVFLGFISIYAGMGKLCDPVYFDGGKRGSMVKWLNTLHPWEVAEPLRQFALQHPVGSGLVIAFLQVVVGVLTILGCWQRVAAVFGALLSAALIVTVSWKTVPAYDAPDIIYLAAWSPLIIAGAPVYSVDGRLAGSAWRTLGPRSDIWELRRFVLRRGALVTAVTVGLTLLVGSLLGGAVRDSSRVVVPGPGEAPRNNLPGSALPEEPAQRHSKAPAASTPPSGGVTAGASPSGAATAPGAAQSSGSAAGGAPSQTQGTAGQAPPRHTSPAGQAPSTTAGPSTGGTATGGSGSSGGTGTGSGGGSTSSGQPGLVGGLLG